MIIDFKYIPTFAQNKTNIPMKRIVLLLIVLLAMGCSKSGDKTVPDDLKVSWTYIQDGGSINEKHINLSFMYDEYLLIVIEKGITKDYSYTEKGSYSYKYPNLSMTSKNGHYKVKGSINEKKDELTLYNFESLHFTPKTKDIVLRH